MLSETNQSFLALMLTSSSVELRSYASALLSSETLEITPEISLLTEKLLALLKKNNLSEEEQHFFLRWLSSLYQKNPLYVEKLVEEKIDPKEVTRVKNLLNILSGQ